MAAGMEDAGDDHDEHEDDDDDEGGGRGDDDDGGGGDGGDVYEESLHQVAADVEPPRCTQSSLSKMNAMSYLVFEGVPGASRLWWCRASTSSRAGPVSRRCSPEGRHICQCCTG